MTDLTPAETAAIHALARYTTDGEPYDLNDVDSAEALRCVRMVLTAALPHIVTALVAAVRDMPYDLGDEGWAALEAKAVAAGWPVEWVRKRRARGDFTYAVIETAYQVGYQRAAEVVRSAGQAGLTPTRQPEGDRNA